MQERISPPLGAYRVRALAIEDGEGRWCGQGQTWLAGPDGQHALLAEVAAGRHHTPQAALDQAYERAYVDTLRLVLREFVCL